MPEPTEPTPERLMRLSQYVHMLCPREMTACGIDRKWQLCAIGWGPVTCPECLATQGWTEKPEVHYVTLESDRTICGLEHNNPRVEDVQYTVIRWNVTCADCRHRLGLPGGKLTDSPSVPVNPEEFMGIEPTREEFEGIDDYEDGPEEDPVQEPGLDERLERNKHRWNMAAGPVHEHDSECCVYLGTVEGWGGNPHRDLYFCAQHGNPTVISREGAFGEYTSGLDFIDVDRHLALAYTRAHSLGLL